MSEDTQETVSDDMSRMRRNGATLALVNGCRPKTSKRSLAHIPCS
jgi:hypothetical protein